MTFCQLAFGLGFRVEAWVRVSERQQDKQHVCHPSLLWFCISLFYTAAFFMSAWQILLSLKRVKMKRVWKGMYDYIEVVRSARDQAP